LSAASSGALVGAVVCAWDGNETLNFRMAVLHAALIDLIVRCFGNGALFLTLAVTSSSVLAKADEQRSKI